MNQRVLSTKIMFTEQDINKQRYEPTLTIDGVPYVGDTNALGALEEITISRAFKYQTDPKHGEKAKQMLLDSIKNNKNVKLGDQLSMEECLEYMQNILVKKVGKGMQINPIDFSEWFAQLADGEKDLAHEDRTVRAIAVAAEGKFSQLFELCSRKRTQLSLPVQTFLPLQ